MRPPKAVVFDLGKVLLDFDYAITARKLAARCRNHTSKPLDFAEHLPLLLRFESGLASKQEFYEAIRDAIGYIGDLDEFSLLFGNIFTPIVPMIELHAELRARGVPTYIFSNTNELAVDYIRQNYPFFHTFSGYVLSYEHRCMKPDPALYSVMERTAGRRGRDLLYIDDRLENIETGDDRGWQTILHDNPSVTRAVVKRSGLLG